MRAPSTRSRRCNLATVNRNPGLGKRVSGMASTRELIAAICKMIETSSVPVPIAFMNYGVDEAAAIIGGVVERCAR
jgi:hypothetical protein